MPDGGLDAEKWLREHNLCALATGRRDGSPQLSLVSYAYDGEDIVKLAIWAIAVGYSPRILPSDMTIT